MGATNSSYTIATVTLADAGSFSVLVSNGNGSTNSVAATLVVKQRINMFAPTVIPGGFEIKIRRSYLSILQDATSASHQRSMDDNWYRRYWRNWYGNLHRQQSAHEQRFLPDGISMKR